jgi:hypothetical protein
MSGITPSDVLSDLEKPLSQRLAKAGNPWQYEEATGCLVLPFSEMDEGREGILYSVPLSTLKTAEGKLDWLSHLDEKSWANDRVLAGFVRAVELAVCWRM